MGPLGSRGAGERQTENVKPPVGKQRSSLTKGCKIDIWQAQPGENKGTNNTTLVRGRDSTYEEEDKSGATGG